jgi:hypothetical protein
MATTIGAEPNIEHRCVGRFRLELTQSMWRQIGDLVHIRGDFCVYGRQFVDQENVLTGFDAGHRLILAGGECSGRINIPVIRSIYTAPRRILATPQGIG